MFTFTVQLLKITEVKMCPSLISKPLPPTIIEGLFYSFPPAHIQCLPCISLAHVSASISGHYYNIIMSVLYRKLFLITWDMLSTILTK